MANNDLHGGAAAGPSTAGPSTAGPSTAGPSTAGPSTAGPSTAGPSNAGPSTAPGLPQNFAALPEGREKFYHRRIEFARLRQEFKNRKLFRPDMKAMKRMNAMNISFRFSGSGSTPGVEVGDTFDFRSEMFVVGLHQAPVAGICSVKFGRRDFVATSIVASGGYEDDDDRGRTLTYSGQGGNDYRGSKQQVRDQRRTRGNAAMRRSMELRRPVRVIRGLNVQVGKAWVKKYTYDGLYKVIRTKVTRGGKSGHRVYKFKLRRCPGQPNINITRVGFGGDEAH